MKRHFSVLTFKYIVNFYTANLGLCWCHQKFFCFFMQALIRWCGYLYLYFDIFWLIPNLLQWFMYSFSIILSYICDWICKKWSYMHNYKYVFEIFNLLYLKNARSGLHTFLHYSIAIQDHPVDKPSMDNQLKYPLFDSFIYQLANTTSTYRGGG